MFYLSIFNRNIYWKINTNFNSICLTWNYFSGKYSRSPILSQSLSQQSNHQKSHLAANIQPSPADDNHVQIGCVLFHLYIFLFLHVSTSFSFSTSLYLYILLFLHISTSLSIHPYISASLFLSLRLYISLHIDISTSLLHLLSNICIIGAELSCTNP